MFGRETRHMVGCGGHMVGCGGHMVGCGGQVVGCGGQVERIKNPGCGRGFCGGLWVTHWTHKQKHSRDNPLQAALIFGTTIRAYMLARRCPRNGLR